MVGLFVAGDNHLVVRGPEPDDATARALLRHWSVIKIGQSTPEHLLAWRISTKEFREELEWAIVDSAESRKHSPAVTQLLSELSARGIRIRLV